MLSDAALAREEPASVTTAHETQQLNHHFMQKSIAVLGYLYVART